MKLRTLVPALTVLVAAIVPHSLHAQGSAEAPYTLMIGGVNILAAVTATVGGSPLDGHTRLGPQRTVLLTGVSSLAGGAEAGDDCDFVAPTCDGTVRRKDPTGGSPDLCFQLYDVSMSSLKGAQSGQFSEQLTINVERIEMMPQCPRRRR